MKKYTKKDRRLLFTGLGLFLSFAVLVFGVGVPVFPEAFFLRLLYGMALLAVVAMVPAGIASIIGYIVFVRCTHCGKGYTNRKDASHDQCPYCNTPYQP